MTSLDWCWTYPLFKIFEKKWKTREVHIGPPFFHFLELALKLQHLQNANPPFKTHPIWVQKSFSKKNVGKKWQNHLLTNTKIDLLIATPTNYNTRTNTSNKQQTLQKSQQSHTTTYCIKLLCKTQLNLVLKEKLNLVV